MAKAQILHVFQGDKRSCLRFPGIRLPGMEADFPKIGQSLIIYPILREHPGAPAPTAATRPQSGRLEPFDDERFGKTGAGPFLECRQ